MRIKITLENVSREDIDELRTLSKILIRTSEENSALLKVLDKDDPRRDRLEKELEVSLETTGIVQDHIDQWIQKNL